MCNDILFLFYIDIYVQLGWPKANEVVNVYVGGKSLNIGPLEENTVIFYYINMWLKPRHIILTSKMSLGGNHKYLQTNKILIQITLTRRI